MLQAAASSSGSALLSRASPEGGGGRPSTSNHSRSGSRNGASYGAGYGAGYGADSEVGDGSPGTSSGQRARPPRTTYESLRAGGLAYADRPPSPSLPKMSKFSVRAGIPALPVRKVKPDVDSHVWGAGRDRGGPTFQYVSAPPVSTIPPLPPPKSHLWSMTPPQWLLSSPRWGWRMHSARRSSARRSKSSPGTPNLSTV